MILNKVDRKLLLIKKLLGEIKDECEFALLLHEDGQAKRINPDMPQGITSLIDEVNLHH